jgi:hypothetical protein
MHACVSGEVNERRIEKLTLTGQSKRKVLQSKNLSMSKTLIPLSLFEAMK